MLANLLTHAPISAHFSKNHKDFIVKERPAYEFSGSGEWLIVHVRKKDLTTADLIKDLASACGIKARDIGYAGLKDRAGMTEQFLSLPRKCEALLSKFSHEKARILGTTAHENKLKIGHLIGNWFMIRLKKVDSVNALKLEQAFAQIERFGFANYFGYQRFGRDGDNAKSGLAVLRGEAKFGKKVNKFLISAAQSELFNEYLSARVQLSRLAAGLGAREFASLVAHPAELAAAAGLNFAPQNPAKAQLVGNFLLFDNDFCMHYPKGKIFAESLAEQARRFSERDLVPAGLLLGANADMAALCGSFAGELAAQIFAPYAAAFAREAGSWRHLISYATELRTRYDEQQAHFVVEFFLQKGSYATALLAQALGGEI